jgi:transposase
MGHLYRNVWDNITFLYDYGEGAPTRVPGTERYRKPRLFVMTLLYSRRCFRRVVWKSSQETWSRLHEDAWRYFGGSCRYVVLDNLKEGVTKPRRPVRTGIESGLRRQAVPLRRRGRPGAGG